MGDSSFPNVGWDFLSGRGINEAESVRCIHEYLLKQGKMVQFGKGPFLNYIGKCDWPGNRGYSGKAFGNSGQIASFKIVMGKKC